MERLLITRKEAAEALSISVDKLDDLHNDGKIRCVYIGARRYYTPDALTSFLKKEGSLDA